MRPRTFWKARVTSRPSILFFRRPTNLVNRRRRPGCFSINFTTSANGRVTTRESSKATPNESCRPVLEQTALTEDLTRLNELQNKLLAGRRQA